MNHSMILPYKSLQQGWKNHDFFEKKIEQIGFFRLNQIFSNKLIYSIC